MITTYNYLCKYIFSNLLFVDVGLSARLCSKHFPICSFNYKHIYKIMSSKAHWVPNLAVLLNPSGRPLTCIFCGPGSGAEPRNRHVGHTP